MMSPAQDCRPPGPSLMTARHRLSPLVRLLAARWALSRIPALGRAPASYPNAAAVRRPLGVPDDRVGEVDEAVPDGPSVKGADGLLVADLVEEAIASPEHDRVDR